MPRVYGRDGRWGIDYTDHRGRRVRKMVATDRSVALRVLGDALDAAEKMRAGLVAVDPREAKKPMDEHVEAYLGELERRGRAGMYVFNVQKHLEIAVERQDWECLADCTHRSINTFLQRLGTDGKSPKTVNQYRADLSAFFEWGTREGLMAANPCAFVSKITIKQEKTRRALSVEEVQRLLDKAPKGRRVVYLFLALTGLRRGECKALKWCHVRLGAANASLDLPPTITKSGRAESLPLIPTLAGALRAHRGDARDSDPVFERVPDMDKFREDLKAADIEEVDARGRRVVLHCLRHSLATMLAQSQVPPAIAMKVLRHRDIRLTLETYTDEGLLPLAAAMNTLPKLTIAS